ncbi:MAG: fibronectin type III domain-containing protein [Acidobacteria bacterium]|nr:fibronectin type III domain-containing protein [Acidobacteriota bacterium]
MKRLLGAILLILAFVVQAQAVDVTVKWIIPPDVTGIAFYRLFWGTTSRGTSELQSAYPNAVDIPGGTQTATHTVPGFKPGTLYFFAMKSIGPGGEAGAGTESKFSPEVTHTTALLPPSGVTITEVVALNITRNQARISWKTNKGASCKVRYGLATPLNLSVSGAGTHWTHNVWLTGLKRNTRYYYRAESTREGLTVRSELKSFRTLS